MQDTDQEVQLVSDPSFEKHGASWFEGVPCSVRVHGYAGPHNLCLDVADLYAFHNTTGLTDDDIVTRASELRFRKSVFCVTHYKRLFSAYRRAISDLKSLVYSLSGGVHESIRRLCSQSAQHSLFGIILSSAYHRRKIAVLWPPADERFMDNSYMCFPAIGALESEATSYRLLTFSEPHHGHMRIEYVADHIVFIDDEPRPSADFTVPLEDIFVSPDCKTHAHAHPDQRSLLLGVVRNQPKNSFSSWSARFVQLARAMSVKFAAPHGAPELSDFSEYARNLSSYTDVEVHRLALRVDNLEGKRFAVRTTQTSQDMDTSKALVASVDISSGSPLCSYAFEEITRDDLIKKNKRDPKHSVSYCIRKPGSRDSLLDGFPARARFIEHPDGTVTAPPDDPRLGCGCFANCSKSPNARIFVHTTVAKPSFTYACLVATRDIAADEDIEWDYKSPSMERAFEQAKIDKAAQQHGLDGDCIPQVDAWRALFDEDEDADALVEQYDIAADRCGAQRRTAKGKGKRPAAAISSDEEQGCDSSPKGQRPAAEASSDKVVLPVVEMPCTSVDNSAAVDNEDYAQVGSYAPEENEDETTVPVAKLRSQQLLDLVANIDNNYGDGWLSHTVYVIQDGAAAKCDYGLDNIPTTHEVSYKNIMSKVYVACRRRPIDGAKNFTKLKNDFHVILIYLTVHPTGMAMFDALLADGKTVALGLKPMGVIFRACRAWVRESLVTRTLDDHWKSTVVDWDKSLEKARMMLDKATRAHTPAKEVHDHLLLLWKTACEGAGDAGDPIKSPALTDATTVLAQATDDMSRISVLCTQLTRAAKINRIIAPILEPINTSKHFGSSLQSKTIIGKKAKDTVIPIARTNIELITKLMKHTDGPHGWGYQKAMPQWYRYGMLKELSDNRIDLVGVPPALHSVQFCASALIALKVISKQGVTKESRGDIYHDMLSNMDSGRFGLSLTTGVDGYSTKVIETVKNCFKSRTIAETVIGVKNCAGNCTKLRRGINYVGGILQSALEVQYAAKHGTVPCTIGEYDFQGEVEEDAADAAPNAGDDDDDDDDVPDVVDDGVEDQGEDESHEAPSYSKAGVPKQQPVLACDINLDDCRCEIMQYAFSLFTFLLWGDRMPTDKSKTIMWFLSFISIIGGHVYERELAGTGFGLGDDKALFNCNGAWNLLMGLPEIHGNLLKGLAITMAMLLEERGERAMREFKDGAERVNKSSDAAGAAVHLQDAKRMIATQYAKAGKRHVRRANNFTPIKPVSIAFFPDYYNVCPYMHVKMMSILRQVEGKNYSRGKLFVFHPIQVVVVYLGQDTKIFSLTTVSTCSFVGTEALFTTSDFAKARKPCISLRDDEGNLRVITWPRRPTSLRDLPLIGKKQFWPTRLPPTVGFEHAVDYIKRKCRRLLTRFVAMVARKCFVGRIRKSVCSVILRNPDQPLGVDGVMDTVAEMFTYFSGNEGLLIQGVNDSIKVATMETLLGPGHMNVRGKKFVDVGCGDGRVLIAAVALGATTSIGFEFEENKITHVRLFDTVVSHLMQHSPLTDWKARALWTVGDFEETTSPLPIASDTQIVYSFWNGWTATLQQRLLEGASACPTVECVCVSLVVGRWDEHSITHALNHRQAKLSKKFTLSHRLPFGMYNNPEQKTALIFRRDCRASTCDDTISVISPKLPVQKGSVVGDHPVFDDSTVVCPHVSTAGGTMTIYVMLTTSLLPKHFNASNAFVVTVNKCDTQAHYRVAMQPYVGAIPSLYTRLALEIDVDPGGGANNRLCIMIPSECMLQRQSESAGWIAGPHREKYWDAHRHATLLPNARPCTVAPPTWVRKKPFGMGHHHTPTFALELDKVIKSITTNRTVAVAVARLPFCAPTIESITPGVLPCIGGTIVIRGRNLGETVATSGSIDRMQIFIQRGTAVARKLSYPILVMFDEHVRVQVTMPSQCLTGTGIGWSLFIKVDSQISNTHPITFNQPIITRLRRVNTWQAEGVSAVTTIAPSGCRMQITGRHFGDNGTKVLVILTTWSGCSKKVVHQCTPVTLSSYDTICIATFPPIDTMGCYAVVATVIVDGQESNNIDIDYARPIVDHFDEYTHEFVGKNFWPKTKAISVLVGGVAIDGATVSSPTHIVCNPPSRVLQGRVTVTLMGIEDNLAVVETGFVIKFGAMPVIELPWTAMTRKEAAATATGMPSAAVGTATPADKAVSLLQHFNRFFVARERMVLAVDGDHVTSSTHERIMTTAERVLATMGMKMRRNAKTGVDRQLIVICFNKLSAGKSRKTLRDVEDMIDAAKRTAKRAHASGRRR